SSHGATVGTETPGRHILRRLGREGCRSLARKGRLQDLSRGTGSNLQIDRRSKERGTTVMLKASAILAIAFLLTFVLRKRAAAERHMLWAVAIICAALLPVLSSMLPVWQPGFAVRIVASLPRLSATATDARDAGGPAVVFHAQSIESKPSVFGRAWLYVW